MANNFDVTFQIRRDTQKNWETLNPILSQGEPALNLDDNSIKIGDGKTAWKDLMAKASSNWDAKENEPGYIKNRTHYTEETEVPYIQFPFDKFLPGIEGYQLDYKLPLIIGETYNLHVEYGGEITEDTAIALDGTEIGFPIENTIILQFDNSGMQVFIGVGINAEGSPVADENSTLYGMGCPPEIIMQLSGKKAVPEGQPSENLSSIVEIIHRLDKKYLPPEKAKPSNYTFFEVDEPCWADKPSVTLTGNLAGRNVRETLQEVYGGIDENKCAFISTIEADHFLIQPMPNNNNDWFNIEFSVPIINYDESSPWYSNISCGATYTNDATDYCNMAEEGVCVQFDFSNPNDWGIKFTFRNGEPDYTAKIDIPKDRRNSKSFKMFLDGFIVRRIDSYTRDGSNRDRDGEIRQKVMLEGGGHWLQPTYNYYSPITKTIELVDMSFGLIFPLEFKDALIARGVAELDYNVTDGENTRVAGNLQTANVPLQGSVQSGVDSPTLSTSFIGNQFGHFNNFDAIIFYEAIILNGAEITIFWE